MNYNNIYKTKVEDEKENKENKEQLEDNQNEEDKPKKIHATTWRLVLQILQ